MYENNKKYKKIGIVAWATGDNSFGVTKPYLDFFSKFGIVIMISPQQTDVIEDLDLLVLPGGRDVAPYRYGQAPGFWTGHPDVYLEHFDTQVLHKYISNNVAIFGICRGLQTLNVFFEGTLKQHLYNHPYSGSDRKDCVHLLNLNLEPFNNSNCFKLTKDLTDKTIFSKFRVNSLHHQAIDDLGKDFSVVAYTKNYNNDVEAIIHNKLPIAAVQYHPEEIHDALSYNLITQLLFPIIKK